MGKKKSRRKMESCNKRLTKGCTGAVNSATARSPNTCHSCWKSENAKALNHRKRGDKKFWKSPMTIDKWHWDKGGNLHIIKEVVYV